MRPCRPLFKVDQSRGCSGWGRRATQMGFRNRRFWSLCRVALLMLGFVLGLGTHVLDLHAATRTWAGLGADANWNTVGNWNFAGIPAAGDSVVFGTAFTSGTTISLNGDQTATALTISTTTGITLANNVLTLSTGNLKRSATSGVQTVASGILLGASGTWNVASGGTFTVSGVIDDGAGTFGFTKTGTGTLFLTGANTYDGTTAISAGVINIQNATALGATSGNVTIANGAALQIQGGIGVGVGEDVTSVVGTGVGATGAIRNISGNNTWNGTLALAGATSVGSDAGTLTLAGGVDLGANRILTVRGNGNTLISGVIVGTGTSGLTKQGTGTLTLTAANTYTGGTTISAGIVNIQNNSALGTTLGDVTIANGATLQLQGGLTIGVGEDVTSIIGTGVGAGGAMRSLSGNNTWNGSLALGGNATVASDLNTLTLAGNISLGANRRLTVTGAGDTRIDGLVSGTGTSGITKSGAGTLTLTAANTFNGNTTISAGIVNIRNNAALGNTSGNVSIANGATLQLQDSITVGTGEDVTSIIGAGVSAAGAIRSLSGNNTWNGVVTLGGNATIAVDSGSLVLAGNVALGGNRTLSIIGSGNTDINGIISGTGSSGISKSGTGTLTLRGANTFAGNVAIGGGIVNIRHNTALGTTVGNVTVSSGAALELQNTITVGLGEDVTSVAGSGIGGMGAIRNVQDNNVWNGSIALTGATTIGVDAGTLTVNGVVSGAFGLTKVGGGVLRFAGATANTYSGVTTVTDGRVELAKTAGVNGVASAVVGTDLVIGDGVGGAGSAEVRVINANQIINTADVSVASDGLFALAGTASETINALSVTGGSVTVGSGSLTLGSGLTLTGGSATLGSGSLVLGGTVTVNGSAVASTLSGGSVNLGATPRIFAVADGIAASELTVTSALTGTATLTKTGAGTMTLSGASATYAGTELILNEGTLLLDGSDLIGNSTNLRLGGGTFATGGNSDTLGQLTLAENSHIDLGGGSSVIHFADSSAASWTAGKTVYIEGWSGSTSGGGTDQILFGTSASALLSGQLGQIFFVDPMGFAPGLYAANLLPSGEIVPIPELRTTILVSLMGVCAAWRERRRWKPWVRRLCTAPG